MKCENIQFSLPIYFDDGLSISERKLVDEHLPTCPLCRQKLSEYRELRNEMRRMAPSSIPEELLLSVRNAVAFELNAPAIRMVTEKSESYWEKFTYWLMPYSIGTVASLVLSFALLSTLSNTKTATDQIVAQNDSIRTPVILADSNATRIREELSLPEDYTSVALGEDAPEVNPKGALYALTESVVRGKMKDNEVVLVADVFSNGLARIAEIIEPPVDSREMRELEKAFQTDPQNAPFLPPAFERKSNAVRMVLKIQHVEVAIDPERKGSKSL